MAFKNWIMKNKRNKKYCQQYCWIINIIADNIVSNIADSAIVLAILSAILLNIQQYCQQYCTRSYLAQELEVNPHSRPYLLVFYIKPKIRIYKTKFLGLNISYTWVYNDIPRMNISALNNNFHCNSWPSAQLVSV